MFAFNWSGLTFMQCLFFIGHGLHLRNTCSPFVTAYTHVVLVFRESLCRFYSRLCVLVYQICQVYRSSSWYITGNVCNHEYIFNTPLLLFKKIPCYFLRIMSNPIQRICSQLYGFKYFYLPQKKYTQILFKLIILIE